MHSIFPEHFKSYRFATALVISVLFTAGCSGSSDSQPPAETNAVNADAVNTDAGSTTVIVVEPEPTDITPVVEVPEFTRVEFDINVPAFQSNALQVRLQWGSMDILASFVVDESWSASADFPTNTENDLVVTFNDGNGAITLGSFEQSFGTGTNASESFQITSDQFDTERWDSDGDGLSNLSESLAGTNPLGNDPPSAVQASLEIVADKTFRISWEDSDNAEFYRVLENPDGVSGFTQISDDLALSTLTLDHRVALFSRINARYIVQACNDTGCINSTELIVSGTLESAITYVKPSNTRRIQFFGGDVSLSSDGSTLAVGSRFESSLATGINGDQGDDNAPATGAVYVFVNNDGRWEQQAYIKASNANGGDLFGFSVSLNADGNTLAVGAFLESSIATGINGNQNDNSLNGAGAVYVFTRNGSDWQQEAYIKASNTGTVTQDLFGSDVSLSADGNTLAVGALGEDSGAKGVNPMPTQNTISRAGATYVFVRSNGSWQQQAYIKASNSDFGDEFGRVVSLSADGDRLAVGAHKEQSGSSGINGIQTDNSIAGGAGAVYLYARSNDVWQLLAP